jgi:simple sugar transport system ATP-binding protein
MASDADEDLLLHLRGITKRYPMTLANDQVELKIRPGGIHALLGENGAGKSTLVKTIYGVVRPDAGEIFWNGQHVEIRSPQAARLLGIGMVFQHFSLFEGLTVADNLALGVANQGSRKDLRRRVAEVSQRYGLPLDPDRHVSDLSLGERQRIEIVRCLMQSPRLLIMDEPTSVLTPQEVDRLFETLRQLAEGGCAVLYISHKLKEIKALCSAATIMRQGRVVAHCDPRRESTTRLAELMIGETLAAPRSREGRSIGASPFLAVERLTVASDRKFGTDLKAVSLSVYPGQILGIAGVAGNGQTELMDALSGELLAGKPEAIRIDGLAAGHMRPGERRKLGACFVPEERNGHAAVPVMSLSENALLSGHVRKALSRLGLIDRSKTTHFAREIIDLFDVRTSGPLAEARSLSGGNLQKFVVGREILQEPKLIVISQPTWGVDAGAAHAIHNALVRLAESGAAVVVVSQDLDEILSLCDSLAVLSAGRLSTIRPVETTSLAAIGLLMGGSESEADGAADIPQDEPADGDMRRHAAV